MDKWILSNERLPNWEDGVVLATIRPKENAAVRGRHRISEITLAICLNGRWEICTRTGRSLGELSFVSTEDYNVIAWMPLPEPYWGK